MTKYRYYQVLGGAVRLAYDRWLLLRNEQWCARLKLCAEFGADTTYANDVVVVGLVFNEVSKTPPPAGWKRVPSQYNVYKPHGGSKEMKAIRKRLRNDYPLADTSKFQEFVTGAPNHFLFMESLTISFMRFEHVGDHLLLLIPDVKDGDAKWQPPDERCVLMKNSEYWMLKESVGAPMKELS